ncbi:MAG: transketolase [Candidatus Longimicrobiales bacterium M2_2A_002]
MTERDRLAVDTLRFLAADAVENASSGHPGMPMGAAPMAYALWTRFLRYDPADPSWFDRDRFILSAGHGSMLLYGLLHLSGYDLSLDEIRDFRQWGSRTPGHPEVHLTPGVEATTGPLGQGFGNGVGMAMAERFLAHRYNRPDHEIVDHHIYAICSDGDLMEGVASEAASLAGHMKLGKLVYLYDDNHISIEGDTALAFTEDVDRRFEAYGWHVQAVEDGEDMDAIAVAIREAQAQTERPSLIRVRTHIGYGSPKQDDASVHGSPLGAEALRETRETLGWPLEPHFHVPDEAYEAFRPSTDRGRSDHGEWTGRLEAYRNAYPELAAELERAMAGDLPDGWDEEIPSFEAGGKQATRASGGKVLNAIARRIPTMLGGSADLAPSNKTLLDGETSLASPDDPGRNIHFGVREHAMGAAANGMALHGGVTPYTGTFLIFSDYMRPSIRLAALSELPVRFIFTHDSIGLGEDGPTHQPVEQLPGLRSIPNLVVFRPADANETAEAWRVAMTRPGPVAFSLTRQGVPVLDPERYPIRDGVPRGAYVLEDAAAGSPDLVLMATGSEVSLALAAAGTLREDGVAVRVVSMPSLELFREQPDDYREQVLPPDVPRLAIEAASPLGWHEWVGAADDVLALDRFGASAPGDVVMEKLGFNVENVVRRARSLLGAAVPEPGG